MRTETSHDGDWVTWFVLPLAALLLLYVGLYFLTVRPAVVAALFTPGGTLIVNKPDYHGLPPELFAPLNHLDRKFLRPAMWNRVRVWDTRTGQPLTNRVAAVINSASNRAGQAR